MLVALATVSVAIFEPCLGLSGRAFQRMTAATEKALRP